MSKTQKTSSAASAYKSKNAPVRIAKLHTARVEMYQNTERSPKEKKATRVKHPPATYEAVLNRKTEENPLASTVLTLAALTTDKSTQQALLTLLRKETGSYVPQELPFGPIPTRFLAALIDEARSTSETSALTPTTKLLRMLAQHTYDPETIAYLIDNASDVTLPSLAANEFLTVPLAIRLLPALKSWTPIIDYQQGAQWITPDCLYGQTGFDIACDALLYGARRRWLNELLTHDAMLYCLPAVSSYVDHTQKHAIKSLPTKKLLTLIAAPDGKESFFAPAAIQVLAHRHLKKSEEEIFASRQLPQTAIWALLTESTIEKPSKEFDSALAQNLDKFWEHYKPLLRDHGREHSRLAPSPRVHRMLRKRINDPLAVYLLAGYSSIGQRKRALAAALRTAKSQPLRNEQNDPLELCAWYQAIITTFWPNKCATATESASLASGLIKSINAVQQRCKHRGDDLDAILSASDMSKELLTCALGDIIESQSPRTRKTKREHLPIVHLKKKEATRLLDALFCNESAPHLVPLWCAGELGPPPDKEELRRRLNTLDGKNYISTIERSLQQLTNNSSRRYNQQHVSTKNALALLLSATYDLTPHLDSGAATTHAALAVAKKTAGDPRQIELAAQMLTSSWTGSLSDLTNLVTALSDPT